jgi:hypothetical protein
MAAPPRCRSLSRRGTPLPQWPPPPGQTKLAMTGPAELVTCDQTIEHTVRFAKQTLGWTTPRPCHPEQADRWTWLVLAAYTQLRLARAVVCDQRLPWERPRPQPRLSPVRSGVGFRSFWSGSARQLLRRNPLGVPQADPRAGSPGRPRATRRSRSPPRSPARSRPRPRTPPDRPTRPPYPLTSVDGQPTVPAGLNHKLSQ